MISYFVHIHKRTRFIHIAPLFIHVFHLYSHLYNYAIDNNHSSSAHQYTTHILSVFIPYQFNTLYFTGWFEPIQHTSTQFFLSDVTITHIHINLFHTNVLSIYKCQFVFLQLWHSYTPIIQSHKLFTHVCICFIHSPFRIHTQKRFAHIRLYRLYTNFSFIHALHSYTQNLSSCRIITHTFHTLYSHLIGIHVLCRFIHILSLTHIHNSFMQWVDSYTYHNHSYEGYIHKRILCTHNLFLPIHPFRLFILVYYTCIISIQSHNFNTHIQLQFVFSLAQIFVYQEISITDFMYSIHLINSFLDLSHTYTILFLSRFIIIRILGRLVHITYVIHIYIIYSFGLFVYASSLLFHSHFLGIHTQVHFFHITRLCIYGV